MEKFTPPFLLIRQDGATMEFNDLVSLACAVREAKITVSTHNSSWHWSVKTGHVQIWNEWIVRDNWGKIVTPEMIANNRISAKQHAASLGLPIPYTGKRKRYGRYLRYPSGLSTYRAWAASKTEGNRLNGKIKLPPTAWDDICRSDLFDRNWKRNRRTQWKE